MHRFIPAAGHGPPWYQAIANRLRTQACDEPQLAHHHILITSRVQRMQEASVLKVLQ